MSTQELLAQLEAEKQKQVQALNASFRLRFKREPKGGEEWLIEELACLSASVTQLLQGGKKP